MVMIGDLMERHTFAMGIKEQQVGDYRKRLGMIWQELTGFLDQNQISNFSIWSCGRLVFGYCETEEKKQSLAGTAEEDSGAGQKDGRFVFLDFRAWKAYAPDV